MLKRSLTAIALLAVLAILSSLALGKTTKRRKPQNATVQTPAPPNTTLTPITVKGKKPGHFAGGSDDGSSIRRKQPGRRRH